MMPTPAFFTPISLVLDVLFDNGRVIKLTSFHFHYTLGPVFFQGPADDGGHRDQQVADGPNLRVRQFISSGSGSTTMILSNPETRL